MTSDRGSRNASRRSGTAFIGCIAVLLVGCAVLPDDAPVVEQLDPETGLTVMRLGHPLELYREATRQERADRFGFLGPFEINQMGKREQYLWVALPFEGDVAPSTPTVTVDGSKLELGETGRAPDFAGLRSAPYKIPTPWIASYYFRIDSGLVARLGAASEISVSLLDQTRNGPVEALYKVQLVGDPRLRAFSSR
jgi:hypothetical protein